MSVFISIALFVGCVTSNAGHDSPLGGGSGTRYVSIAGYSFKLPDWWNTLDVTPPGNLKTEKDIMDYVVSVCGSDTGSIYTWRTALKIWAIACERLHMLPVYIAHCYKAGGELLSAAEVYGDLYFLADTQGEYEDWFKVYLSYSAGEAYFQIKDYTNARPWYEKSAEYAGSNITDDYSAIEYYATQSQAQLEKIDNLR